MGGSDCDLPRISLRVYLDTTVFAAMDDEAMPERLECTRAFWDTWIDQVRPRTSEVVRYEISQVEDDLRRERLLRMAELVEAELVDEEMEALAQYYVKVGVFRRGAEWDALHAAIATITRQDILVSWNYADLVNRRTRTALAEVNSILRLPTPEILVPPEL